jgi:hypothetical protein
MIGATARTRASPHRNGRLGPLEHSGRLPAQLVQDAAPVQVASMGVGMIQGLHQRPGVRVELHGPVRMPERPERVPKIEVGRDPDIEVPVSEGQMAMLRRIVQGQALLTVGAGRGEVTRKDLRLALESLSVAQEASQRAPWLLLDVVPTMPFQHPPPTQRGYGGWPSKAG